MVLDFLKARQTVGDVGERRFWKLRLIRGLYERGLGRKDVQQLFRLIHFFMILPAEVENEVWQTVQTIEQEKQMPYMTPLEEIWLENGKKQGIAETRASLETAIERSLRLKFGTDAAASLMPEFRSAALSRLYDTLSLIVTATSPDELRQALSTPNS